MKPSITPNKGFTLIEVMIAVFVLAIGILGVAGLQLFANQNTYEANQRTTAAALATSMIERMRRNPAAADNTTATDYYIDSTAPVVETTGAPACDSTSNTCTPVQLAAYDLQAWHNKIAGVTEVRSGNNTGGLVAPSACITQPTGYGAKEYRISIAWRGRSPLSDPTADLCGQGSGLYGDSDGNGNAYRRVYFIDITLE